MYSSRYAGPDATYADNCNLLLKELGDSHQRGAAFACVLYCIAPDGAFLVAGGVLPVMKHLPGHGLAMADTHHGFLVAALNARLENFSSTCRSLA